MKNIALLVHACDRYQLLFKGFHFFFSKHWDARIKMNYYFVTEELSVTLPPFKNIQSGKGEWSDRLRTVLQNLEEDYILYFQEDMWLSKNVNALFFKELNSFIQKNTPLLVKLHSSEVYKTNSTSNFINGLNVSTVDNKLSKYLMSHQVSIWNRKFLIDQLKKKEHPWRNERRGTKRLKKLNPLIYQIDLFAENGKPAINQNQTSDSRSEYFTVSVNALLTDSVLPYLDALIEDKNHTDYGQLLKKHFENQITHDGKAKPRKEDIFQKIKKYFKK